MKPSLVFFKRFTEDEEVEYSAAKSRAEVEIRQKHTDEIETLQKKLSLEKGKKHKDKSALLLLDKELRDLEKTMREETKPLTKEYFDYEIPVANVEDAGITSTGSVSEGNQLPRLQEAFKEYRSLRKLWDTSHHSVSYAIDSEGHILRLSDGEEAVLA